MKFLKAVKGCSFRDRLRNDDIRKNLKLQSVLERIKEYRQNWKSHLELMIDTRIPKQAFEYLASGDAVSYTHLDVYKRQQLANKFE